MTRSALCTSPGIAGMRREELDELPPLRHGAPGAEAVPVLDARSHSAGTRARPDSLPANAPPINPVVDGHFSHVGQRTVRQDTSAAVDVVTLSR